MFGIKVIELVVGVVLVAFGGVRVIRPTLLLPRQSRAILATRWGSASGKVQRIGGLVIAAVGVVLLVLAVRL